MFSNDFNTRDLYFSNPIEHFLVQDHDIKTSYESGFSSSHNHTGNSKEVQYKSSQDLFNQTRSQDLFSQNDRTNSQFGESLPNLSFKQTKNLDYEKYISQNLLLGKESPKRRISSFDEKETRKEKQTSPLIKKGFDENHFKEIKTSLDTLNDCVNKLNSEINLQKNNFLEELSRLNERISFLEKVVGQKFEFVAENLKSFTNIIKKEQNDKKQFEDKISEVVENVKNLENEIKSYTEQSNKLLEENIKKISKSYEEKHKKQLQKLQDQYSNLEKTVRKMNSLVESSLEKVQVKFENSLDHKLDNMKEYFKKTIDEFVQMPRVQDISSLMNKQIPPMNKCDLRKDAFHFTQCKEPVSKRGSGYTCRNSDAGMSESIPSLSGPHTPPSLFMNKYDSNAEPMRSYHLRATVKPEVSNYNDAYSNLKVKRKVSTPLRHMISPTFKKPMQNTNSHCTPLISKFSSGKRHDFLNRNETSFAKQKYGGMPNKMGRSIISNSSPALTVIEAATIAKSLYAFRSHRMYNK